MNTNALEVKINAIEILKNLAKNLGTAIFEYVEDIAKLCIESLLDFKFAQKIRHEAAKCMKFLIQACEQNPQHQRALYIMTYSKMFQELEKRLKTTEFDQVNSILKNLSKMLSLFSDYKEKGIEIYTEEDAKTFYNKLIEVIAAIKKDKETRLK